MKTVKYVGFIVMLFFFSLNGKAQAIPQGLDSVLVKTLDSMRTVLNVKSLSAAIQFSDTTSWASASGISSVNPTVNVTTDDAYLIGSITKTITSACILQLVDEQKLKLDDSLYMYLDTMPFINPNITIRQLLRHQSGIYDVLSNPNNQPTLLANQDSIWTPENLIATFIQAPNFQPGTAWEYSNTNYFLLGMIIKQITGNEFYQEYRNRFFTPLGLNTVAIPAFETLTSPVAHVWLDITGDGITDDAHNFYMNYKSLNSTAGAAGGFFATPSDISHWMRTYMRGDLLSAAMMTEAKVTVNAPGLPSTTYGLGLMKKTFLPGIVGYGHGGDLAYSASSWYFPARDISITVFNNDSKNNSWTLLPVVTALLKRCNSWLTTDILESVESQNIQINAYPNPFENAFTVAIQVPTEKKELKCILSNAMGQEIAQITQNQVQNADFEFENIESLQAGVYMIQVFVDGNQVKTLKMVK